MKIMTTPSERTRAVLLTESFLITLINHKLSPKIPKGIREQAKMLLRHYPSRIELEMANKGWYDESTSRFYECPFGKIEE
jgi:hypothetical protein